MEAEMVRELLSSSAGELANTAQRIELPLPIARELKGQALNLLTGKCVRCGKPSTNGMCSRCKKQAPDRPILRTTRERLLKKLNPNDILLRSQCTVCNKPFVQTVGFALKMLERFGRFDPAKACPDCRRKRNRPLKENKVLTDLRSKLQKEKGPRKRGQNVKKRRRART